MSDSIVITPLLHSSILIEVYSDQMYLPLGPRRNSFSVVMYDFVVSTANSVMKPATILSSEKSTAQVNLLFTCCNCWIC
jgi:hypothetical protein